MNDVAIRVERVSKDFVLPHLRKSTLKSVFTGVFDLSRKKKNSETQHALHDISFEIKKGEFFGIVGRNGSGKSTLLKILAGIYQPTKGTVNVNGKLVPFIELGVGFNPDLSGRDNVYLNGALLGFSKKKIDEMYDDIVKFAELEKFMDQKLKNYSSGMQVRLAFSMAVRSEADILLVDEVLAVGDADFQRKCFGYFRELKRNKKTVVFVSHDMSAVREYCDRAIMIEKSKIIASGKAEEIANKYTRMFIEEAKTDSGAGENTKRWGDGAIVYESVKVMAEKLTDDQDVLFIEAIVHARETVENPIFGIMIKNGLNPVLGTNTKIKAITIKEILKGEKRKVFWEVPNIFSDGKHYIDPAIVYKDGTVTSDWWEEACEFEVYKEHKTPYLVTPNIKVEVKRIK